MTESIYISGPITGHDKEERTKTFGYVDRCLKENGYQTYNPMEYDDHPDWNTAMRCCITALMQCDSILMIDGWWHSPGARIEHTLSRDLGLTIYYETEGMPGNS